ncbi:hypothetical protein ABW20_dc0105217 [Dactylellina cionopaga]|nr:hypothetical protein ABW20_dc0105217 [Dactylellina cionopaga]
MRRPIDDDNMKQMTVRLLLLVPRLKIRTDKDQEKVRRDSKELAAMFRLTDDIRIQTTGDLKFYYSNAFFDLKCLTENFEDCEFGEHWCCYKHNGENLEQVRSRVIGLDPKNNEEKEDKAADALALMRAKREKRDRCQIERCLEENIEIPMNLRQHYAPLIQELKEERKAKADELQAQQTNTDASVAETVKAPKPPLVLLESSSETDSSAALTHEAELTDLLSTSIPKAELVSIKDFTDAFEALIPKKTTNDINVKHLIIEESLQASANCSKLEDSPALIILAETESDIARIPEEFPDLDQIFGTKLPVQSTEDKQSADWLVDVTFDTECEQLTLSQSHGMLAPQSVQNFHPQLSSAYEPSIFDFSDHEILDLGPVLQPTTRRTSSTQIISAIAPTTKTIDPTILTEILDTPCQTHARKATEDPSAQSSATAAENTVLHLELSCGHFVRNMAIEDYRRLDKFKCPVTVMKRHPICYHAVEASCYVDANDPNIICDFCK